MSVPKSFWVQENLYIEFHPLPMILGQESLPIIQLLHAILYVQENNYLLKANNVYNKVQK